MKLSRQWFVVAGALMLTVVVAAASSQSSARVVKISAERFAFSPSEVPVKVGEEIEIRLTSEDTSHGFRLVGQEVDLTIPKRGKGDAVVKFKAPKAGRYEFECSHLCGAGHSFMRGVIVAKDAR